MKVIFLDIDGVLNCKSTKARCGQYIGIDTAKVKLVNAIVEKTGANIVLSSTWKEHWNKRTQVDKYMHNKFSKGHIEIYSCTDQETKGWQRGNNIKKWIKEHDVESWVVLDDEVFLDYDDDILERLVKTEWDDEDGGLNQKDVETAIKILNDGYIQDHHKLNYEYDESDFHHIGLE